MFTVSRGGAGRVWRYWRWSCWRVRSERAAWSKCFFFRVAREWVSLILVDSGEIPRILWWLFMIANLMCRCMMDGGSTGSNQTLPCEISWNLLHYPMKSVEICCITLWNQLKSVTLPYESNWNLLHYPVKSVEICCITLWNQLKSVALPYEIS